MTFELVSHTVLVDAAPDRTAGPVVRTIPVAEEVLTSNASPIGVYPSWDTDPAWGVWVGADRRLSTADGDTSYGQYTGSAAAYDATRGVGIRNGPWTPASGSTPVSAVIEFQAWAAEPVRWSGFVQTNFSGTGSFSAGNITSAESAASGWITGSIPLSFPSNSTIWGLFASAVAAGNIITNLRAFLPNGSTLYDGDVRVSKLELKVTMNELGAVFTPVPFGRTGCDLLPDGSYVVACYSDMQTLPDVMNVWKVSSDGDVLGHLVIDTGGDTDGRAHVIALDGFLVQVLYPTGTFPGGMSYVLDCSDNVPELVASFDDTASTANAYGAPMHHLYLRGIGVVAVCHRLGTSLYRRGRHLISRSGTDATGEVYGMFPHPTDPTKFAAWFSSGASDREYTAWEFTVTAADGLLIEELGPFVSNADIYWMVGGGNPYAAFPLALQEGETGSLEVIEAADALNVLWSDPGYVPDSYTYGINSENISCQVGDSLDHFAFSHEIWRDEDYDEPAQPGQAVRAGIVDNTSGTPVVEMLDLEYGAGSPSGYPDTYWYVSLITGSMAMAARNGELVVSTCIVEQEKHVTGEPNYYSVVSWKLSLGEAGRVRLSGTMGSDVWRRGINNASGLLSLQTTEGMLPEASEKTGLDAPARPAWIQTTQGRELIGRFVDVGAEDLPDPVPPMTADVVFRLGSINTDLAAAITLAGSSFTQYGNTWGPFVAQAGSPPSAITLVDGTDATTTTLANVSDNTTSQPVEVFTARLSPATVVPAGGAPIACAFTIRARATSGDPGSYLDMQITTSTNQATIRGQSGNYQLQLPANLGPSFVTSNFGIYGRYPSVFEHPGRFTTGGYTPGQDLATALAGADEGAALWWAGKIATPGFYITVQNALTNPAHGPVEIAELYLTMRYLMP